MNGSTFNNKYLRDSKAIHYRTVRENEEALNSIGLVMLIVLGLFMIYFLRRRGKLMSELSHE